MKQGTHSIFAEVINLAGMLFLGTKQPAHVTCFMGLLSNVKNKVIASLTSEMIADLGTLPITSNKYGRNMSLSIRRQSGREPYVQVRIGGGRPQYFKINCSKAWADQFERLAHEIRKHANTETPGHKDK